MKRRCKVEKSAFLNEHHGSCLLLFFAFLLLTLNKKSSMLMFRIQSKLNIKHSDRLVNF